MIQNPPQDTVRAACALLLGLCCFLPSVLAAFPAALSLLLLLASACFLPPRPCSHLGLRCPHLSLCVVLCVVCCPFLAFFCGFLVCFCLVFLVRSSCCVVVFVCCAWCQLTDVTKDCRGPPAPTSHTHTRHRDFLPPLAYLWEGGLSLNSFLLFVLAVLLPCPSGTSVLFCKGSRI